MDDSLNIPPERPPEGSHEELHEQAPEPAPGQDALMVPEVPNGGLTPRTPDGSFSNAAPEWILPQPPVAGSEDTSRRRNLRHNLSLLLMLTLAAFVLTAWILVRSQSPFGIFSTGPQDVVRAQLRALDLGELRAAYGMFSPRYRQEVSFEEWNHLITTHWRMFHAEVLGAGAPAQSGARVTLEIRLRGADDKGYRAHFTLIRLAGRWWVDDLHWSDEASETGTSRT